MNNEPQDSQDIAVITTKAIINGSKAIHYVTHDAEDGSWQFLEGGSNTPDEADASVVSMKQIQQLDPSLEEVKDLPPGWNAYRDSVGEKWVKSEE